MTCKICGATLTDDNMLDEDIVDFICMREDFIFTENVIKVMRLALMGVCKECFEKECKCSFEM